jgi:WD40 repeat protein
MKIWNALTAEPVAAFPPLPLRPDIPEMRPDVQVLVWSPDGARLAAAGAGVAIVVDARDGGLLCTYRGHEHPDQSVFITSLAWSPDGQRVASGAREFDNTAQVWNGLTGAQLATFRHPSVSPDSGVYVCWALRSLHVASTSGIWDTPDEVQIWPAGNEHGFIYRGHRGSVFALAWSPDGTRIASGGVDQSVQVWAVP